MNKEDKFKNNFYGRYALQVAFFTAFLFLAFFSCDRQTNSSQAPDFDLMKLDGKSMKLSDLKGKAVLLNFWATYCPPCVKEMPMFQTFFEKYQDKNFVILGISADQSGDVAAEFIKKMGITYPIGMATKKIVQLYKVYGLPTSFMLNKQGDIIQQYIGPPAENMLERDILRALNSKS
jgi:peroxiredoxin